MKPIFLGWNRPIIRRAADYLIERHAAGGRLDLSSVTLILPGKRAKGRMEEILAEKAAAMRNPAWYPPEIITPESLPENFYERRAPFAPDAVCRVAWIRSAQRLAQTDPRQLQNLLPDLPKTFGQRLALGRTLFQLYTELTAERVRFQDVAETVEAEGIESESLRWRALAALERNYVHDHETALGYLDQNGMWDRQAARLFAADRQSPEEYERIVRRFSDENRRFYLVGLVDMNRLLKDLLKKFEAFVTPLTFAPETLADRFDEFGSLIQEKWSGEVFPAEESRIRIVRQPEEEADAVMEILADLGGTRAAGEVIVGVPDDEVIPFLEDRLAEAGIPSRSERGIPFSRGNVYRFFDLLRNFLRTRRYQDYAELVRHPEMERFLRNKIGHQDYLTQLDDYHNEHFPVTVSRKNWERPFEDHFGEDDPRRNVLAEVWAKTAALTGIDSDADVFESHPVGVWVDRVEAVLTKLYGHSRDPKEVELRDQFRQKGDAWRNISQGWSGFDGKSPERFTFAEFLDLFLLEFQGENRIPDPVPDSIELLGWLDLMFDDTPVAVVTGMNEGVVPSFTLSHPFLPDHLRKTLGLTDSRRRLARDAYALNVLAETRRDDGDLFLIAGRCNNEGESKFPSRFLFLTSDPADTARRVKRFLSEKAPPQPRRFENRFRAGRRSDEGHGFGPALLSPVEISNFSVTDFQVYLECPRKYYFDKIKKLKNPRDDTEELEEANIGSIIHRFLEMFGKDPSVRDSIHPAEITDYLHSKVSDELLKQQEMSGEKISPVLRFQYEDIQNRLAAFAEEQARWRAQGYRIVETEYQLNDNTSMTLAGKPVRGKVDRIDHHEERDRWVIFDYKTTGKKPATGGGYDSKNKKWSDLQLPLYDRLLRKTDLWADSTVPPSEAKILLFYFWLPRNINDTQKIQVKLPPEILDTVFQTAENLAQKILNTDWNGVIPDKAPCKNCRDKDEYHFLCQTDVK